MNVYNCFREICNQLPGPHSNVLLGDAFMKIQEVLVEFYTLASKFNHCSYSHDKIKHRLLSHSQKMLLMPIMKQ